MIKRKIVIINKVLQLRYAGVIIASMVMAVGLVFVSAFNYVNFNSELLASVPGSKDIVYGLAKFIGVVMLFYVVIVVIFSIFASHKFAGPLYRFQQVIKSISEGDLTQKAVTRDNDELNEIRDGLNNMISSLRNKLIHDRDRVQMILAVTSELKSVQQDPAKVRGKIETIELKVKEIGSHFKI